jgi:hypothetical protein
MDARKILGVSGMALALTLLAWAGISGADSVCFSTHTSGSGATSMKICISQHGNLMQFESPVGGGDHISSEGYVVCSESTGNTVVHGFDSGFLESGFGPAAITQPNGPNTFPLTIVRDTTDGVFRLTQTFSRDTTEQDVTITMKLKNLSGSARDFVLLSRYFDGDLEGTSQNDHYDWSTESVWGRDGIPEGGGPITGVALTLTALTFGTSHSTLVERFADFNPGSCFGSPDFLDLPPTEEGDWVGRVRYFLGTIQSGKTKTVKVVYRRL